MKITFYHYEDEDITINTDAILKDGKLLLDGLDYGKRVEELRGMGDDYEYKLSLDNENTTKLFDSLGVADKTDKQKLATMKEKFGKDGRISEIEEYCDVYEILKNTNINRIYLNGSLAYSLFVNKYPELSNISYKLPSTSSANAKMKLEDLVSSWSIILEELRK